MAIQTKKKYTGQKSTSVLSGRLRLEQGENRLVLHDGTDYRLILGLLPDGTIGLVISKPGVDVFEAFDV